MSLTSVDLPEPLTPVTAVSTPSGIDTSMLFRLFSRAPRMTISPFIAGRREVGVGIDRAPVKYAPVSEKPGSGGVSGWIALEPTPDAVAALSINCRGVP